MNYSGFRLTIKPAQQPTHAGRFAKTNPKNNARLSQQHWAEGRGLLDYFGLVQRLLHVEHRLLGAF